MVKYDAPGISTDMSFLEMLDVINEGLIQGGEEPIAFDHDCREGICGMCGLTINGIAHGPQRATTVCQLHIESGGFITAATGGAPDANAIPVPKPDADTAFDAAACIGCGACVAACPNASAMLFTAAKVTHLGVLPQGQAERYQRVLRMVATMDSLGFGNCTNIGECAAVCPKEIGMETIARMNRDLVKATLRRKSP